MWPRGASNWRRTTSHRPRACSLRRRLVRRAFKPEETCEWCEFREHGTCHAREVRARFTRITCARAHEHSRFTRTHASRALALSRALMLHTHSRFSRTRASRALALHARSSSPCGGAGCALCVGCTHLSASTVMETPSTESSATSCLTRSTFTRRRLPEDRKFYLLSICRASSGVWFETLDGTSRSCAVPAPSAVSGISPYSPAQLSRRPKAQVA